MNENPEEEIMSYTCKTCGAVADEPGHLCAPSTETTACPYCGKHTPHVKHYCKGKMEDLKYVCEGCGRLATSPDLVCKPSKVPV
jgi:DNA-directed RNA polymerase subunit RPC12/RpoP